MVGEQPQGKRAMAEHVVDLASWPRAEQFRWFRRYDRPHYAVTSRLDATRLLVERKPAGASPYRACLYAIGYGLHAVPELLTRFRGETVLRFDRVDLSMSVPLENGSFNYAYVPFLPDPVAFDAGARARIEAARAPAPLAANDGTRLDLAYLSCLPWLDYTALDNALPGPDDCIPRVSWGRFTPGPEGRWSVAMTLQVHHALVDGRHVGLFFEEVQRALEG